MISQAPEPFSVDVTDLSRIAGDDVLSAIVAKAPTKVLTRVAKASDHVSKGIALDGVDDEMGVFRFIAAEEELVVALFEWLKLNTSHFPEHRDFVGKKKNHQVKLSVTPVLAVMYDVMDGFIRNGIGPSGLEDVASWQVLPAVKDGRVVLALHLEDGKHLLDLNPLDVAITLGDTPDDAVIDALFHDFRSRLGGSDDGRVKRYVNERADFRNKLLYADDGHTFSMGESLAELRPLFERDLRRLLWSLAALLTNKPVSATWGPVGQFISLYRRVLLEAKVLRQAEGRTDEETVDELEGDQPS
jgi:hypothetical protein